MPARLAPSGEITIGLVGNSVWSERLGIGYGWEVVEVMAISGICRSGVMISSGTATRMLRARAVGYGVADRIDFIPQIPYDSVGEYLSAIHICFSTQTNDVPGNKRTTGKLPLFLAAGRYILASDVGEAARVLKASKLENYQGTVDRAYFGRMLSVRAPHPGDAAVSSNTPEVQ